MIRNIIEFGSAQIYGRLEAKSMVWSENVRRDDGGGAKVSLWIMIRNIIEFGSAQIYGRLEAKSRFWSENVHRDDDCGGKVSLWVWSPMLTPPPQVG